MPLNPPVRNWEGRVVWVVGGSSGIGHAVACDLARQGAKVVVSARNVQALDAFVARFPDSLALPLDVTDVRAFEQAVGRITQERGELELVLYCAGYFKAMRAQDYDLETMLQHEQVNYVGALNMLHAVLPPMRAQGAGHLSFVSSVAGFTGLPQSLAYGPTKAALTHLAEVLYQDLKPLGIHVSVVHPGFVETPLTARNPFPMPAIQTPEQAATAILNGWSRGRFEIHFPRRFTLTLKFLRLLPYRLYFALVRRSTGL
jgi:NAD(P)-dependent dehydrogenase (short-subunit alcohol dehydrogenase family)